jgi:hypothetical protein
MKRRQRRRRVRGQRRDQPRHRRIRGNRPEHLRLRTRHRHIGQALPAQGDRHRQIPNDLARIVFGAWRSPPPELLTQGSIQTADLGHTHQQRRTRRAHQRLATDQHPPGANQKEDQQSKIRLTEVSTVSGDCRAFLEGL